MMRTLVRSFRGPLVLLASLLITATAFASSQTGSLTVVVTDQDGNPLSDVGVTVQGASLPGFQFRETDEKGRARFSQLPPADYTAEFEKDGYTAISAAMEVGIGSSRVRNITLNKGGMEEEVTVTGEAPIDMDETGISYSYSAESMQHTQIGSGARSYLAAVGQAAGVVGGGGNPNVHGATIGENRYLVDGVDTTDPLTGTFGQNLNFDTIQAVNLRAGAFTAEHGGATGGIIDVVTKSGGNEFEGSMDLRYRDEGFTEDSNLQLDGEDAFDNELPSSFKDYSFALGGPIIKDKLWFQLGYEFIENDQAIAGSPDNRLFEGDNRLVKLTWQPHQDHRVSVQYTDDPSDISGTNAGVGVLTESLGFQEQGARFVSGTYWGIFNDWELEAHAGYYKSELNAFPLNDSGANPRVNLRNGFLSGNYDDAQFSDRRRNEVGFDVTHTTNGQRWHEIKFGASVSDQSFKSRRAQPGMRTDHVLVDPTGDDPYGLDPDVQIVQSLELIPAPPSTNEGALKSLYVQDTWHATPDLVVDYGIRWDHTSMDNDLGEEVVAHSKLQPRLGMSWDVLGDGNHKLSWFASRAMDPGLLTIANITNERSNATDYYRNEAFFGTDFNGDGNIEDALYYAFTFGGGPSKIDSDIEPMYKDELTFGYEHVVNRNVVLGARAIFSKTHDIMEDTLDPSSPGDYFVTNFPGLVRRYKGLELTTKYDAKHLHFVASWTISASEGNVEYTQSLGTDYDILPFHATNRYGYLSDDRRHRVKINGWAELPKQFVISYDFFYGSGRPYNRTDSVWGIGDDGLPHELDYGVEFVEPRGSRRINSIKNLDVGVSKTFDLGDQAKLSLIGTVQNFFKSGRVTSRRTAETRDLDPTDPTQLIVLPSTFGQVSGYQTPRRYELGLRLTF